MALTNGVTWATITHHHSARTRSGRHVLRGHGPASDERVDADEEPPEEPMGVEQRLHGPLRSVRRERHSLQPMPPRMTVTVESSSTPVTKPRRLSLT